MPYPSSSQVPALSPPLVTSSNINTESPKTSTKRSPSWSTIEEENLIRIYKEEVESLQKKGENREKGQTMWATIAEKLAKEMSEPRVNSSRTPQRVKDKFFNLIRKRQN